MHILRALFWFAVVAILMPRGPDLGFDLHQLRAEFSAQSISFDRPEGLPSLRTEIAAARIRAEDPIRIWRDDVLKQLARVRMELAKARSSGDRAVPALTSRNPLF